MILSGSGKVFIFGRTILRERSIGHTREGRKIRQCSGLLLIRLNALIWLLLMERVYSVVPTKNSKLLRLYGKGVSGKSARSQERSRRIETLPRLRCRKHAFRTKKIPAVKSPFIEGSPVYPGGKFFEKTHTQICVREASCILGLFIVQDIAAWKKVLMFSEKSELPR